VSYYWPIMLIVASNVVYHITAKSVPETINPLASLSVTYIVSAAIALTLYFFTSPIKNLATEYTHLNWTAVMMGLAIVGLEYGSINMYKAGWDISIGSLFSNIALALALIVVGLLFYKETINLHQLVGIGLCCVGLVLISK
jgi:uncharacterized membrane protein